MKVPCRGEPGPASQQVLPAGHLLLTALAVHEGAMHLPAAQVSSHTATGGLGLFR
jgi:hypothetical protein